MESKSVIKRKALQADDLISRKAVLDALDEIESEVADGYGFQYEKWRKRMAYMPGTRLTHCKDCKHWDGVDTCDVIDAPVWDYDFCSMAERRKPND